MQYTLILCILSFNCASCKQTIPMSPQLFIHTFHYSPDRWSYYGDYMYCQMQLYYADETNKSPINEIKEFIRHVRSLEEAKNRSFFRAPFLAELELIRKLRETKLQHLLELGMIWSCLNFIRVSNNTRFLHTVLYSLFACLHFCQLSKSV